MALTRTLTFNLTATLTGTITSTESVGSAPTEFGVWTGPDRPADLFTTGSESNLTVGNSFAAVGLRIPAESVDASFGADIFFSPGGFEQSNGWSVLVSGGNFTVTPYSEGTSGGTTNTAIPIGKVAFVMSRHDGGFRLHLQTASGLTTYDLASSIDCTNFLGYYYSGTLESSATEWWSGPIEADPISGAATIEAWLAGHFA